MPGTLTASPFSVQETFIPQSGVLYVVATPIGNLRDISPRALDVLAACDLIAAEDTRTTQQLLNAWHISGKLLACHEHNEAAAAQRIVAALQAGQRVALVSDAGTPAISDPGARVVAAVRAAGCAVSPIPGASAAIAALSVAGLDAGDWLFHGFLPAKPGHRRRALEHLRDIPAALVFYEAPHRIVETLTDLASVLGAPRGCLLGREISKRFEQFHRASLGDMCDWIQADSDRQRGEFVLIVDAPVTAQNDAAEAIRVLDLLLEECSPSQAARLAARITGHKKSVLYDLALSKTESHDE